MKDPLGVSPSKGNQGTTRGKEKFLLTSVRIEPTTSRLDLPLLGRLSYEVGQRRLDLPLLGRLSYEVGQRKSGLDSHRGQKKFFFTSCGSLSSNHS